MTSTRLRRSFVRYAIVLVTMFGCSAWTGGVAAHDGPHSDATPSASPVTSASTGTGAVYLTITNTGNEADTLIGGSTTASQTIEVHNMEMKDGIMSMVHLENGLEIAAGASVTLDPSGYHIMLVNLNHDLTDGLTFDLTLTFAGAGDVVVPVVVQAVAPESPTETAASSIVVSGAWSRPAPMIDDCGCGIPDSAKDLIPVGTPAS